MRKKGSREAQENKIQGRDGSVAKQWGEVSGGGC